MSAALRLFDQLGIKTIATYYDTPGPLETACSVAVDRLIQRHGQAHTILTLRTITESEGNNRALIDDVIGGVSDVILAHPRWANLGLEWLNSFDKINLLEIRKIVKNARARPLRAGIATLIALELEKILGPSRPKPPVRTKAQVMAHNLALGIALLRIKEEEPARFGALAYELHKVEPRSALTYRTMAAARLYADRPEITGRMCWEALRELSAPSLPSDLRRKFETAVIGGQNVRAEQIRASRQARAKRSAVQPARMAA